MCLHSEVLRGKDRLSRAPYTFCTAYHALHTCCVRLPALASNVWIKVPSGFFWGASPVLWRDMSTTRRSRTSAVGLLLACLVVPAAGVGWTEDDLWAAEMKLDELRDAVIDQVWAELPDSFDRPRRWLHRRGQQSVRLL